MAPAALLLIKSRECAKTVFVFCTVFVLLQIKCLFPPKKKKNCYCQSSVTVSSFLQQFHKNQHLNMFKSNVKQFYNNMCSSKCFVRCIKYKIATHSFESAKQSLTPKTLTSISHLTQKSNPSRYQCHIL